MTSKGESYDFGKALRTIATISLSDLSPDVRVIEGKITSIRVDCSEGQCIKTREAPLKGDVQKMSKISLENLSLENLSLDGDFSDKAPTNDWYFEICGGKEEADRIWGSSQPDCMQECGGPNEIRCESTTRYDVSELKKTDSHYSIVEKFPPTGGFNQVQINRVDGTFSQHCQSCAVCGNANNSMVWQGRGTCKLETEKLKF